MEHNPTINAKLRNESQQDMTKMVLVSISLSVAYYMLLASVIIYILVNISNDAVTVIAQHRRMNIGVGGLFVYKAVWGAAT